MAGRVVPMAISALVFVDREDDGFGEGMEVMVIMEVVVPETAVGVVIETRAAELVVEEPDVEAVEALNVVE